jgi:hypothetical protein
MVGMVFFRLSGEVEETKKRTLDGLLVGFLPDTREVIDVGVNVC